MIVGIDEVGRGCWAGPVVAGAVILPTPIAGLKDSKKLSKLQREKLAVIINEQAIVGIGWVPASQVDAIGLQEAVRLAMADALSQITDEYDELIIDGDYNFFPDNSKAKAVIKADDSVPAVSAASIVAKVARDNYMAGLEVTLPGYGFGQHVGYGTALHLANLQALGITLEHRLSFKPVKALIQ
jgi:ribonuclease HII